MKKLSLLSLFWLTGLLAFIATPIYAQDFADEVVDDTENFANEIVVWAENLADDVEDEIENVVYESEDAINDEIDSYDLNYDFSDMWGSTDNEDFLKENGDRNLNAWAMALLLWLWFWAIILIVLLAIYCCLLILSTWEVYRKAGKKLWAFLVPFWGTMVYSKIAGMSKWLWLLPWLSAIWVFCQGFVWSGAYWIILDILSIISWLWLIIANYRVARRYGWNIFASILHALIIFCPITILVLWLGNYQYQSLTKKEPENIVEA